MVFICSWPLSPSHLFFLSVFCSFLLKRNSSPDFIHLPEHDTLTLLRFYLNLDRSHHTKTCSTIHSSPPHPLSSSHLAGSSQNRDFTLLTMVVEWRIALRMEVTVKWYHVHGVLTTECSEHTLNLWMCSVRTLTDIFVSFHNVRIY